MRDSQPHISHIFISTQRGEPVTPLTEAQIVANWGLDGDRKARADSKRQVYVVDEATLESVDLRPGDLNENLTVGGIDVNALATGQRIQVGDALLEITGPCTVCGTLEEVRPGLKEALRGRRGVLARVIASGAARVGDALQIL